ncbi:DUF4185 domain-containing protein [Chitinophaga sancti]|uniref:DUF4185 domain-containing protein n=1 Tax=Chitinophaga sancti TaxID=1004 RepID=A0A1K1SGB1_9BACT|nr:DUF4185 domain-containing protein [Chitinophaga sancti]WQD59879.1 DUF4185 domain-containing protein [Chitinophaga sancti]WQG87990.1 DUF4185 domain-containing protein [Chitinophaga sancti]SFW83409.1 protein of unknown function [Chitinophaga sancti]
MKTQLTIGMVATMLCFACTKMIAPRPEANENLAVSNSAVAPYQDASATAFFRRTSGSIAFDGALSVPLSNGKVVWLFNDTFYDDLNSDGTVPCIFNKHNTVLIQPANHSWDPAQTTNLLLYGNPDLFQSVTPGNYFWPSAGVEIGNKVYTVCLEMSSSTGQLVNEILAALNEADNTVSYTTLPDFNGIDFTKGMVKNLDGYVYVWGGKLKPNTIGQCDVYVARFPQNSPGSWTFWNGTSWGTAAAAAAVIVTAPSGGISVSYVNTKYVMIVTNFNMVCDGGTAIYGAASSSPVSGWDAIGTNVIYNIPDRLQGHTPFFYTPCIHPEFNANNEFLFTYCINTYQPCVAACNNNKFDPDIYRPRAVRVPFSVLNL